VFHGFTGRVATCFTVYTGRVADPFWGEAIRRGKTSATLAGGERKNPTSFNKSPQCRPGRGSLQARLEGDAVDGGDGSATINPIVVGNNMQNSLVDGV
jgi:hypothetical protein